MRDSVACAETPAAPLHAWRDRLAERLGPGIGIACMGVDGNLQALYPEELAAIPNAVPRRQREFAAGREAARQAMAQIGWPPMAILSAPDRSPVWPEGLAGSITHTSRVCVAVVGLREEKYSIGIDLEEDLPIDPSLWNTICTPEEYAFVKSQPARLRGSLVTRLFSAKEAFYKWQYPQTRHMLDFQDVHIVLSRAGFPTHFRIIQVRKGTTPDIQGQYLACDGHFFTWVIGNP